MMNFLVNQPTHPALRAPLSIEGIHAARIGSPLARGVARSAGVCNPHA
jgi:hypothetical protein